MTTLQARAAMGMSALALCATALVAPAAPAQAAGCTVTVTTTAASGPGSLAQALSSGGTICFNIPGGGVKTILPSGSLTVGIPSVIDGTTQPGYAGTPLIEISGSNAGGVSGIVVNAGSTTIKGLAVNSFAYDGIILNNNGGNTVVGNHVGVDPSGTVAKPNGTSGIGVATPNNRIGGSAPADRNLVSGNRGSGIAISGTGAKNNVVSGNYVGTNRSGTSAIPNAADGVLVTRGSGNRIGGTAGVSVGGSCTGECNLLSGNGANGAGLMYVEAQGNVIIGNYIGVTADGRGALGNSDIGAEAQDAPNNRIGGTTPAERNILSANGGAGVSITGTQSTGNTVSGNYIGTDRSGLGRLGNRKMGVNLGSPDSSPRNASHNTIGGTAGTSPGGACTGACNVIVDNAWSGVYISGTTGGGNSVAGNFIGVGADGTTGLGNRQDGIGIVDSSNNGIGGPVPAARNLVSGNGGNGIAIVGGSAGGNRIEGNFIGEATHAAPLGNQASGVSIFGGIQTAVIGNNIWGNAQYAIDIAPGGPTGNDPGDGDGGPNGTQNYPVLASAIPVGGSEQVRGSLNSLPSTYFRIDFFQSPACDRSGYGQGWYFLGSTVVGTDGGGNASFAASVPLVTPGMTITSTATRMVGQTPVETSEMSGCVQTPRVHPDGALVQPVGSGSLFLVEDQTMRPIGSMEVLRSHGMSTGEFKTATNGDTNLPGGANLYFREGTLIRGSGPAVYAIDQVGPGQYVKRWISTYDFFLSLGYTQADVIIVPDSALGAPDGPPIADATRHPDGTIIRNPANGQIYLLMDGKKRYVGSMPMFVTWRYDLAATKTATAADLALPNGDNMPYREGAVLKGSAPDVYVIDHTPNGIVKRRLGSVAAMVELGYGAGDVIVAPDQELPAANGPEV